MTTRQGTGSSSPTSGTPRLRPPPSSRTGPGCCRRRGTSRTGCGSSTGRADRAVLSVRDGARPRPVRVPGISGRDLSHVLVSRDGSRLVAVVDRGADDRIVVSRIRYDRRGRVVGATRARAIAWEDQPRASVLDIGWSSPTSLAVLHRLSGDLTQLDTLPVDGAPAGLTGLSVTLQGPVRGVASSPRDTEPVLVQTQQGLLDVLAGSEVALPGSPTGWCRRRTSAERPPLPAFAARSPQLARGALRRPGCRCSDPDVRDAVLDLLLGGSCVACGRPGRAWCAGCRPSPGPGPPGVADAGPARAGAAVDGGRLRRGRARRPARPQGAPRGRAGPDPGDAAGGRRGGRWRRRRCCWCRSRAGRAWCGRAGTTRCSPWSRCRRAGPPRDDRGAAAALAGRGPRPGRADGGRAGRQPRRVALVPDGTAAALGGRVGAA